MRFVKHGSTYEDLKAVVFEVMNISPYHWDVKMSFKYPQLGIGNVVTGYYLRHISSDDDVRKMLSVPRQMQMGYDDVSVFIEAENKVSDDQPWYSQPTQQSYEHEYGRSQYSKQVTAGW